jgi:ADP-ribose pyrophosphatase YjhB (NUDIX family)
MALPQRLIQPWFRLTRGMTLGVRGLVIDGRGQVLLVRQTYAPGLVLPGGGVERRETLLQSLERELEEEASVHLLEPPPLHAVYSNEAAFPGDHVALFVVRAFEARPFAPTREISEARFHDPARLPRDVTPGTARRIAEIVEGRPPSAHW